MKRCTTLDGRRDTKEGNDGLGMESKGFSFRRLMVNKENIWSSRLRSITISKMKWTMWIPLLDETEGTRVLWSIRRTFCYTWFISSGVLWFYIPFSSIFFIFSSTFIFIVLFFLPIYCIFYFHPFFANFGSSKIM